MRSKLLMLICTCSVIANAQDRVPEVKPLPPNAAALFKVLERPTGTFTGTVPVQFPLCGVNSGGVSSSLSLSYNGTGGIRVEEAASCVGIGFGLNDGGGRITQIVHGQGDDWSYGFLTNTIKPSNFDCYDMNGDVYAAYYASYQVDLEPDIFMYNFNGESGKFFFNEQGKIIMLQKTGIKIEYTTSTGPNYIATWTITDESGNKYFFGDKQELQYSYYDQSTNNTSYGVSSFNWYLDSAKDITGKNALYFDHQVSGEVFTTYSGGRMVLPPTAGCDLFDLNTHDNVVTTDGSELIVSKITGRSGFIVISGSTGRQDSYGRKIDSIKLFTPDSQLVKKYKFNYDYFSVGSNMYEKRLYLKDFSEFGSTGNDSLTHKFEYYTDYILPSRLSASVDSWGFYNGTYNNTMFPNYVLKTGGAEYRRTDLADKSANPDYAKACVLKKINYPTGGYREFIYEGNTALVTFNPNLFHPDATNSRTQSFYHDEYDFSADYGSTPFLTEYFDVSSTDGGANFAYSMVVPYSCGIEVKLYKTVLHNQSTGGALIYDYNTESSKDNLDNGYYRIEFYRNSVDCWISSLWASWSECILSLGTVTTPHYPYASFNENVKTVGGLRVSEIRDYDPVTATLSTTDYKYKIYSGDSTLSSGLLITEPQYIAGQQPSGVECYVNAVLASSNYPLASEGGSFVVYPEVRTIENGNGWTDRIYSYAPDNITSSSFPYTPPTDNGPFRGKLIQEKVYNNSGTVLKKKTTSYDYEGWQLGQSALRVSAYWDDYIHCGHWADHPCPTSGISPQAAYCNSYSIQGNACDLYEVIDSTFTAAATLVQKTHYDYDTLMYGRMFLKKIKTYLSNGQIKVTTLRYPYTSNGQFLFGLTSGEQTIKTSLQNLNYFQPIEMVDSLYLANGSGIFTGGSKYIFSNSGNDYFLSKVRTYTTLSDSNEINLSAYDSKWNLTEKYKTNDIKEVYLWGYNYSYPVAKVVGSNYSTVASLVNNSTVQNPANDASLRSELNNIRTALSGTMAQVTTYTYKKGVGITSETDPAGRTIYYEYDNHGRLMLIRDQNNRIMKKFNYNMANPQ